MASSRVSDLHILFFPLMAPGHMLPMLDMAKIFSSSHGVTSTILTTLANAPFLEPSIERFNAESHQHKLNLHLIPFPSGTSLPSGCENLASVPKQALEANFFEAVGQLHQPFNLVLSELKPDCVVTDGFLAWTYDVAAELNIPRLVFHGTNFFSRCAFDSIDRYKPYATDADSFVLSGLPHRIEMLKSQLPDIWKLRPIFLELFGRMKETEPKSYGVVVNSFYELEPEYVEHYREVIGRRAWCVGPVSSCDGGRGSKASTDQETCLNWLDSKSPGSVVYVSFGSLCRLSEDQLRELAVGLERCKHPFIWVIGKDEGGWAPEGYDDRIDGRGLIIRGWAPQTAILGHVAVGGFVTHCGWNSNLEGVSAGLPLVTWPLFAEQFYNERLNVDVLRIGVSVGAKVYSVVQEERPVIDAGEIETAIRRVMDGGEEGEERRRRARELGAMARRAVAEGGSSYQDTSDLIQELMERKRSMAERHGVSN